MSGAPTTTPSAYAETTCPAVGMEIPTPEAICGSSPIVTNSVVPMANPPIASARMARLTCRVGWDSSPVGSAGGARSVSVTAPWLQCAPIST